MFKNVRSIAEEKIEEISFRRDVDPARYSWSPYKIWRDFRGGVSSHKNLFYFYFFKGQLVIERSCLRRCIRSRGGRSLTACICVWLHIIFIARLAILNVYDWRRAIIHSWTLWPIFVYIWSRKMLATTIYVCTQMDVSVTCLESIVNCTEIMAI